MLCRHELTTVSVDYQWFWCSRGAPDSPFWIVKTYIMQSFNADMDSVKWRFSALDRAVERAVVAYWSRSGEGTCLTSKSRSPQQDVRKAEPLSSLGRNQSGNTTGWPKDLAPFGVSAWRGRIRPDRARRRPWSGRGGHERAAGKLRWLPSLEDRRHEPRREARRSSRRAGWALRTRCLRAPRTRFLLEIKDVVTPSPGIAEATADVVANSEWPGSSSIVQKLLNFTIATSGS